MATDILKNPLELLRHLTICRKKWGRSEDQPRAAITSKCVARKEPASYVDAARSLRAMSTDKKTAPPWSGQEHPHFGVHPLVLKFARNLEKRLFAFGIEVKIYELYRSNERQNELYAQGVTKARAGQSPHQYGLAVDLIHRTRGWDLTKAEWGIIGAHGKEVARKLGVKIEWGGDWNFYDPAHWQLADWKVYAHELEPGTPASSYEFADIAEGYYKRTNKRLNGHLRNYTGPMLRAGPEE